jgi:hypothetical protein
MLRRRSMTGEPPNGPAAAPGAPIARVRSLDRRRPASPRGPRRTMREFLKPVVAVEPRPTDPGSARYVRSFLILRVLVGALGVALPFALVLIDGVCFDGDPFPRSSLSVYYYSGVRELFVGTLSAIGVFLIAHKVAEVNLDNTLSLLAGVAVLCVALFPTARPAQTVPLTALQDRLGESLVSAIHYGAAALFIVSLAVMSYFFGKREGTRTPTPDRRRSPQFWRGFHWTCAGVIAAALVWILVTELWDVGPDEALVYGEAISVWAFSVSWLWKGLEADMLRGERTMREVDHPGGERGVLEQTAYR